MLKIGKFAGDRIRNWSCQLKVLHLPKLGVSIYLFFNADNGDQEKCAQFSQAGTGNLLEAFGKISTYSIWM